MTWLSPRTADDRVAQRKIQARKDELLRDLARGIKAPIAPRRTDDMVTL